MPAVRPLATAVDARATRAASGVRGSGSAAGLRRNANRNNNANLPQAGD